MWVNCFPLIENVRDKHAKISQAADIVKHLCSRENYAHMYQLNEFTSERNFMDWPKDLRKDDYYINEEGMPNSALPPLYPLHLPPTNKSCNKSN